MVCLSYIDNKMHYLYLDLGKKYCTIQMPRTNATPDPTQYKGKIGYEHITENTNANFCCV